MNPKITIVTVCYNVESEIESTINSVINQTYPNIEYIIIDGGSDDGTVDIIKKYQDYIYHWISEPDNGVYYAMNKGISLATGEWINFMNAGDTFYAHDIVDNFVRMVQSDVDVAFGDTFVNYGKNSYIENAKPFYEHLPLHHDMGFNHQSSFFRVSLLKEWPFDTKFLIAADYNMVIELYRKGAKFLYLPIIIANYQLGGLSDKKRRLHVYETLMVDNPRNELFNCLLSYIILGKKKIFSIFKKCLFYLSPHLGILIMEKFVHKKKS